MHQFQIQQATNMRGAITFLGLRKVLNLRRTQCHLIFLLFFRKTIRNIVRQEDVRATF